jgi:hypothetical protein
LGPWIHCILTLVVEVGLCVRDVAVAMAVAVAKVEAKVKIKVKVAPWVAARVAVKVSVFVCGGANSFYPRRVVPKPGADAHTGAAL